MRKITDYKEVSPLILRYFKRGVITNCFLTAEDYMCEITEGCLYCHEGKDCLLIYLKRDGFFELYFYALNKETVFEEIPALTVCEAVGGDCRFLLENNGFVKKLDRVQLEIKTENDITGSLLKADAAEAKKIFSLMQKSFDKITGKLPTEGQLAKECGDGLIYCVREQDTLCGILRAGKKGTNAVIKHLCVEPSFRRAGIGKALCKELLKEYNSCTVWTGSQNEGALKLYRSLGFTPTTTKAAVYVKG